MCCCCAGFNQLAWWKGSKLLPRMCPTWPSGWSRSCRTAWCKDEVRTQSPSHRWSKLPQMCTCKLIGCHLFACQCTKVAKIGAKKVKTTHFKIWRELRAGSNMWPGFLYEVVAHLSEVFNDGVSSSPNGLHDPSGIFSHVHISVKANVLNGRSPH